MSHSTASLLKSSPLRVWSGAAEGVRQGTTNPCLSTSATFVYASFLLVKNPGWDILCLTPGFSSDEIVMFTWSALVIKFSDGLKNNWNNSADYLSKLAHCAWIIPRSCLDCSKTCRILYQCWHKAFQPRWFSYAISIYECKSMINNKYVFRLTLPCLPTPCVLQVLDIIIHRFLEVHQVHKRLEMVLEQLGALYKFHGECPIMLFSLEAVAWWSIFQSCSITSWFFFKKLKGDVKGLKNVQLCWACACNFSIDVWESGEEGEVGGDGKEKMV